MTTPTPEPPPEPAVEPTLDGRAEVDVAHPLSWWLSGTLEIILASGGVWRVQDLSAEDAALLRAVLDGSDTDETPGWDAPRWVQFREDLVAGAEFNLAPRQPTDTPVEHRRELAAHGHPVGWLESLRQLYAGLTEPSFSATSMAILARYAQLIRRPTWDLLARAVEGDRGVGVDGGLESWVAAHPDYADLDGDDAESGDAASWSPDDADDGSTSAT